MMSTENSEQSTVQWTHSYVGKQVTSEWQSFLKMSNHLEWFKQMLVGIIQGGGNVALPILSS